MSSSGHIAPTMTKGERDDLCRLIRQRERVLKSAAAQRSAELLADFERQLGTRFSFDADHVWKKAYSAAEQAVSSARAAIADRCHELGVPAQFAPSLSLNWYSRGENAARERRAELRKMAASRIKANEQAARVQIELEAVKAQTAVIAQGLTSEAARTFLDQMPSVESLMPPLELPAVEAMLAAPSDRRSGAL